MTSSDRGSSDPVSEPSSRSRSFQTARMLRDQGTGLLRRREIDAIAKADQVGQFMERGGLLPSSGTG